MKDKGTQRHESPFLCESLPVSASRRPLARQLPQQAGHPQRRLGAFASFVSYVAAGAVDRLFERIAGEQTEQDRNAALDPRSSQLQAHGTVDVLVVARFAADHGAQAE